MGQAVDNLKLQLSRVPIKGYVRKDGTRVKPHVRFHKLTPGEQFLRDLAKYNKTGDPGKYHAGQMKGMAEPWRLKYHKQRAAEERELADNREKRHGKVWPMTDEEAAQVGELHGYIGNDPRINPYWPQGFGYEQYEILMEKGALDIKQEAHNENKPWWAPKDHPGHDISKFATELHDIPPHLIERFVYNPHKPGKIEVGEGWRGDEFDPTLKGRRPRGYSEGQTYHDNAAFFSPNEMKIVLGDRDIMGSQHLVGHEFGHALDALHGNISDNYDFAEHFKKLQYVLNPYYSGDAMYLNKEFAAGKAPELRRAHADRAGRSELLAELFACIVAERWRENKKYTRQETNWHTDRKAQDRYAAARRFFESATSGKKLTSSAEQSKVIEDIRNAMDYLKEKVDYDGTKAKKRQSPSPGIL